ncbi:MAG: hypothetical protein ACRC33_13175 [Gemmataceae bacterium]
MEGGQLHLEAKTKVVALDAPALRRADPSLRLYRTTLCTYEFCYWNVEVLVAAWVERGKLKTAECLSPTYDCPSAAFTGRLRGIRANTPAEQEALAGEICDALEGITYQGRVDRRRMIGREYQADLWRGEQLWRRVRLTFDPTGAIQELTLINPRDLGE